MGKLAEAVKIARGWPADAALVDAAMLTQTSPVALGVPAKVLAAGETEGGAAAAALDQPRGWVAKDAPAAELVAAVEHLLTGHVERSAGSLALLMVGILIVVLLALLLYLLWVAVA